MIELDRPGSPSRRSPARSAACTNCRLHETRTLAVPGEGSPDTEVVFVGEGPGFNEDRQGRPFVGRAGALLASSWARSAGSARTCSSPTSSSAGRPTTGTRSPTRSRPARPYLRRQLEVLDPALVVTLGRHSLGRFMPGERISQAHGTVRPVDPATGRGQRPGLRPLPSGGRPARDRDRADQLAEPGPGGPARPARREAAALLGGARRARRAATPPPAEPAPARRQHRDP
jgi:uracil-DNA glycosylase family 4